ncbi:MAG TPA: DsbA family protein [Thermomicrobiaceae bacterium]|nr:DsbA family protein [Thermomicrobiaceae bacterium]
MTPNDVPELLEWAEYSCPWCYIMTVRLRAVAPEYQGRVRTRTCAFPLEVFGGGAPNRDELEQEWWLAAIQEPFAPFIPYRGDWPTTTLPAFEAAWCAAQQGEAAGQDYDLRVRRAFFGESRDIGRPEVLLEIAAEAGLDLPAFAQLFERGAGREAVLAEARRGRDQYGVRGTPSLRLSDGTHVRPPIAFPRMKHDRIVSVQTLPCHGEGCLDATRELFEQALAHPAHQGDATHARR